VVAVVLQYWWLLLPNVPGASVVGDAPPQSWWPDVNVF